MPRDNVKPNSEPVKLSIPVPVMVGAIIVILVVAAWSYMDYRARKANNGSRTVNVVEINCVFRDPYGQVVLRERVAIVGRAGPLAPGMTKSFRLAFDTIPESWNQALPDLVIAQIVFE